jgi:hypothetical protein
VPVCCGRPDGWPYPRHACFTGLLNSDPTSYSTCQLGPSVSYWFQLFMTGLSWACLHANADGAPLPRAFFICPALANGFTRWALCVKAAVRVLPAAVLLGGGAVARRRPGARRREVLPPLRRNQGRVGVLPLQADHRRPAGGHMHAACEPRGRRCTQVLLHRWTVGKVDEVVCLSALRALRMHWRLPASTIAGLPVR